MVPDRPDAIPASISGLQPVSRAIRVTVGIYNAPRAGTAWPNSGRKPSRTSRRNQVSPRTNRLATPIIRVNLRALGAGQAIISDRFLRGHPKMPTRTSQQVRPTLSWPRASYIQNLRVLPVLHKPQSPQRHGTPLDPRPSEPARQPERQRRYIRPARHQDQTEGVLVSCQNRNQPRPETDSGPQSRTANRDRCCAIDNRRCIRIPLFCRLGAIFRAGIQGEGRVDQQHFCGAVGLGPGQF